LAFRDFQLVGYFLSFRLSPENADRTAGVEAKMVSGTKSGVSARELISADNIVRRSKARRALVLAVAVATCGGTVVQSASAANYYWDGGSINANWSNTAGGTNWSSSATTLSDPGTTPGSGDDVFFNFNSSSPASNTIVDVNTSIKGITFNTSAASAIGIGGTNVLTIGADGLTVITGATGPEVFTTNVAIGGAEVWANNAISSNSVTVSGVLSGNSSLTLEGTGSITTATGTFVFSNTNTFSGSLTLLNAGTQLTLNSTGSTNGSLSAASGIALGGGTSLVLDNTIAAATRLGASVPITSTGGSISLLGNGAGAVSETVGTLTAGSGATNIAITPAGQATTLTINNLLRDAGSSSAAAGSTIGTLGGTINFAPLPVNATVTLPGQAAGFIGAWATIGKEDNTGNLDFAISSGGNLAALSTYDTSNTVANWGAATDVKLSATAALTAATPLTIHTFYSTTAGIMNVNGTTLTISSGGVIANGGTGSYVVSGNQTMNNASVLGGSGFSAGSSLLVTNSKITVAAGTPDFVFNVAGNSAIVLSSGLNTSSGVLQVNADLVDGLSPTGTFTATTTTGSNIVALTAGTTGLLYPGVTVTGLTGLTGTQTVTSVIDSTHFTVASNATTGGAGATAVFVSHTGLTKTGGGLLDLANGNNGGDGNGFTGPLTVNGGAVLVRADGDFGTAPGSPVANAITLNGGEIRSTAGFTISANRGITVGPQGGALSYDGGGTFSATSKITGIGGMTFESISNQGATTMNLSTAAGGLTYLGPTTLVTKQVAGQAVSTIIFTIANELPVNTPLTIANFESTQGTVNMNNLGQTVGSLASTGTIGTILNINNLTIGGVSASPVNQSASYGGTLSGASLTKNGGGTQTFTNASTYTGTTNISGGSLLVTNTTGSATGTSLVNVNSGGSLGGSGIISGAVTVLSGGAIAPAAVGGGTSTLQLKGGLTLNSGSLLNLNLGAPNTPSLSTPVGSPTSDNLFVTGPLVLGTTGGVASDTININALSGFTTGTYDLIPAQTPASPASLSMSTAQSSTSIP
jgi:fibronectin-binding autotransporter adhesin